MVNPRKIALFFVVAFLVPAIAMAANDPFVLPEMSLKVGGGEGLSTTLQIMILLTVLTLIPAAILMMTSFTRFIIVFSLLRQAMGLQQTPPNQVLVGIALFMTFFVMSPVLSNVYSTALQPYLADDISQSQALNNGIKPFRKFMLSNVQDNELSLFLNMDKAKGVDSYEEISMFVLIPAFITGELKNAFQVGFVIFVPFLIIDMVVASVLMSMGMFMLPPIMISLPFKLMIFVLVDGWGLLIGSMVRSFS